MITKTVMCPQCKNKVTAQGNPGEKIHITCPNCNTRGVFTFPGEKADLKPTTVPSAVTINNLTKIYNGQKAVDNISFKVQKGEIFGFLGPNGAGKTTTIKALLGLIHANAGEMKINGFNIKNQSRDAKKNIGYLPEIIAFYDNLTPLQTLYFFCELKGEDKTVVRTLLRDVGLEEAIDKKVGAFSKGMLQLLGIAQTMIGKPSIYILDEPMAGLDARWVKVIRDRIKMLNEQGATVVFSSHILSEVQNLCDKVAIINKGKLIAEDTVPNLNKLLKIKPRLEITIPGLKGKVPKIIKKIKGIDAVEAKDDTLFITCDPAVRIKVISALKDEGYEVPDIKTIEPSLEDAFVKLIAKDEEAS